MSKSDEQNTPTLASIIGGMLTIPIGALLISVPIYLIFGPAESDICVTHSDNVITKVLDYGMSVIFIFVLCFLSGLIWDEENTKEQFEKESENAIPVLEEVKSKEIKPDKHKPTNILIEGDNYHALSVLNYTHEGKIDVIYIDPPYNTGKKDFVYNYDYVNEEDTYKHSKWLSFMSKRLRLAKNLLTDDGVLVVSAT